MKKTIDLTTWKRREHFEFFSSLDEPFHGTVVNVECTATVLHCRTRRQPFFLTYFHKILQAVNATEALRQRIENGAVVEYDCIHSNVTVARADGTFGFCSIDFAPDFAQFVGPAQAAMVRVRQASGLGVKDIIARTNEIHFSALPDVQFTGLTHARRLGTERCEPKISVGKVFEDRGRWWMPLATFVHHGLVDGQHVGQFLKRTEVLLQTA